MIVARRPTTRPLRPAAPTVVSSRDAMPHPGCRYAAALVGFPASSILAYDVTGTGPFGAVTRSRLCIRYLDAKGRAVATVPAPEHFN